MYTGCSAIYLTPFAAWGCRETSPVGNLDVAVGLLVPFSLKGVGWRLSNWPVKPVWSPSFSRAESVPPPVQNHNQKTFKRLLSCFFESFWAWRRYRSRWWGDSRSFCLPDMWPRSQWIGAEHGSCIMTQAEENHVKFMSLPFINWTVL